MKARDRHRPKRLVVELNGLPHSRMLFRDCFVPPLLAMVPFSGSSRPSGRPPCDKFVGREQSESHASHQHGRR